MQPHRSRTNITRLPSKAEIFQDNVKNATTSVAAHEGGLCQVGKGNGISQRGMNPPANASTDVTIASSNQPPPAARPPGHCGHQSRGLRPSLHNDAEIIITSANGGLPRHLSDAPGQPRPPGEEVSYAHPHHKVTNLFNAHPLYALSLLGQLGLAGVAVFLEPGGPRGVVASLQRRLGAKMTLSLGVCGYARAGQWRRVRGLSSVLLVSRCWRDLTRTRRRGGEMGGGVGERGRASSCREGRRGVLGNIACHRPHGEAHWGISDSARLLLVCHTHRDREAMGAAGPRAVWEHRWPRRPGATTTKTRLDIVLSIVGERKWKVGTPKQRDYLGQE